MIAKTTLDLINVLCEEEDLDPNVVYEYKLRFSYDNKGKGAVYLEEVNQKGTVRVEGGDDD